MRSDKCDELSEESLSISIKIIGSGHSIDGIYGGIGGRGGGTLQACRYKITRISDTAWGVCVYMQGVSATEHQIILRYRISYGCQLPTKVMSW